VLASLPEAPEGLVEERRRHSLPAPRATREEHLNPSATVGVGRTDGPGGNLVSGADDAPERRIETRAPKMLLAP
jgi:hypothetical protein